MSNVVIDSSAWVEYFEGTARGEKVRKILARAREFPLTTGMIAAEVIARFIRFGKPADLVRTAMQTQASLVPFDIALAEKTAAVYVQQRKTRHKFGLADAHVLATAQLHSAKVVTCDFDFAGIRDAIVIE
jgi:predicted nucleic acid-binding protein